MFTFITGLIAVLVCGAPEEIQTIINKYEDISYHTCISCGKPAKYLSTGWICPYCEKCAPRGSKLMK